MLSHLETSHLLNTKPDRIAADIRARVAQGVLRRGQQLPSYDELLETYGVSRGTLHQALTALKKDGLIRSRGRGGLFVSDQPPHLKHFALALPRPENVPPDEWPPSRFYEALRRSSYLLEQAGRARFTVYHGVNGRANTPGYRRLVDDLQHRRLAGVVYAMPQFEIDRTLLEQFTDTPRLFLMSASKRPDDLMLWADPIDALPLCLQTLASRGRRRVAFIVQGRVLSSAMQSMNTTLDELLDEHDLTTEPYWIQRTHTGFADAARDIAHLLCAVNPKKRPDALIITDDNLVEPAVRGLHDAGMRIPNDISVFAHANFPAPPEPDAEVTFVGFDLHKMLGTCLDRLESAMGRKARSRRPKRATSDDQMFRAERMTPQVRENFSFPTESFPLALN